MSAKVSQVVDKPSVDPKRSDEFSIQSDIVNSARGASDKDARAAA